MKSEQKSRKTLCFIYLIQKKMNYDLFKSHETTNSKSLNIEWSNLLKQLKNQPKQKRDLPPILFRKKSPLENYKNVQKLQESYNKKKTITQKLLDLSKQQKLTTIDLTDIIHSHKRKPTQNLYTLTQQQKQLLNSKEIQKTQRLDSINKNNLKQISTSEIINKIKSFHVDRINKQKDNRKNLSPTNKAEKKPTLIQQKLAELTTLEREKKTSKKHNLAENTKLQEASRNRKLSFELSKDQKSLHYRYEKQDDDNQKLDSSIPRMLIKSRKQKIRQLFTLFDPINKGFESQKLLKTEVSNEEQQGSFQRKVEGEKKVQYTINQMQRKRQSPKQKYYSPCARRKQRISVMSSNDRKDEKSRGTIKYQPWDNPESQTLVMDYPSTEFSIENYHHLNQQIHAQSSLKTIFQA